MNNKVRQSWRMALQAARLAAQRLLLAAKVTVSGQLPANVPEAGRLGQNSERLHSACASAAGCGRSRGSRHLLSLIVLFRFRQLSIFSEHMIPSNTGFSYKSGHPLYLETQGIVIGVFCRLC